jgi:predicted RNase H-like HicB family nuclease
MKTKDRYRKIVEWSDEDECFIGTCPELMYGGVHGLNEQEVLAELRQVVDEWIQIHEQDGVPLPEPLSCRDNKETVKS